MSTRRMLSRNITVSKKVAKVSGSGGTSDPWGKLLFTWLIPFTDDYGRFHADPHLLKGFIFPLEDTITPKHIEKMLAELDKRKLIVLYDDDGSSYLEIRNFEKFQTFRSDRKRQADFPAPTGKPKTPPGEPDDTPSEEEDKESEEKKKLLGATEYEIIKDTWNRIEWLSSITSLSDTRKKKLKERTLEMNKEGVSWTDLFLAIDEQQDFLGGNNEKEWAMSFDWLVANDTNWVKVYERRYAPNGSKPGKEEPPQPGMVKDKEGVWKFPE